MENRFETFTYLIFKIAKLTQRIKNIEMKDLDLKAVHVMCIYHLSKSENGLTSANLVELTLEDKAAISRALNSLKKKGLIDYDGGYNASIVLTEKGLEIAKYINEKSELATNKSSLDVDDNERKEFYKTLKKIENNMVNYYHELLNEKE